MNLASAKYRIAYEVFSKFSGKLSKAESFDELAKIVKKDLKYLFDHKLFRIVLKEKETQEIFTFFRKHLWVELVSEAIYSYEEELVLKQIPFCEVPHENLFQKYTGGRTFVNPLLWGWYFKYNNLEVCVSVVADDQKRFDHNDVQILNLLVDNIATKYEQIVVKNKLKVQNANLIEAFNLIEEKNRHINHIVSNQKAIIEERTKEIRDQNEKLLQVSRMNAHNVREPLSRILGLIKIAENLSPEELNTELLPYLEDSAQDLDTSLRDIIKRSSGDIDDVLN